MEGSPAERTTTKDDSLLGEVLEGLRLTPKRIPTKLLYDPRGARLFEEITRLEEYYLTRTEMTLLRRHLPSVAAFVGPAATVVEPGSGSGDKTRLLLKCLDRPRAYVPVDVASSQLRSMVADLCAEHPALDIHPLIADYNRPFDLPPGTAASGRTLIFFPGSTLGNFEPGDAVSFLAGMARAAGRKGALILGVDLEKPVETLEPAYNDHAGVTAAFNLNALRHLNRVLGTDFRLSGFRHHAPWVPEHSRIEMRLVSLENQTVHLPNKDSTVPVSLHQGEHIVTEYSYKYSPSALDSILDAAGWTTVHDWMDATGGYSLRLLVCD